MKVDSIPYEEQLRDTYVNFQNQNSQNNNLYFLFLLGTASVCARPANWHNFAIASLDDIYNIFSGLSISDYIYADWIKGLSDEAKRRDGIIPVLRGTTSIRDKIYFEDYGYRTWFPLYYYIYYHLNKALTLTNVSDWNINSGRNNPVMNWSDGWKSVKFGESAVLYYWEFNYQDLYLKMCNEKIGDPITHQALDEARKHAIAICEGANPAGSKTRASTGQYVSIYKWNFNFLKENLCLF